MGAEILRGAEILIGAKILMGAEILRGAEILMGAAILPDAEISHSGSFPPKFWASATISWDSVISCIFDILSGCLCFYDFAWFYAANICVYFQYLFMHCVYTNIFGAIVFILRFKIDAVVIVIWSIVIIINSVLTLQVLTASLHTIASLAK